MPLIVCERYLLYAVTQQGNYSDHCCHSNCELCPLAVEIVDE